MTHTHTRVLLQGVSEPLHTPYKLNRTETPETGTPRTIRFALVASPAIIILLL